MGTPFKNTPEAEAFVATAVSRETSPEIMEAIVAFVDDLASAEYVWEEGLGNFDEESRLAFIHTVTGDGQRGEPSDFVWGAEGDTWAED